MDVSQKVAGVTSLGVELPKQSPTGQIVTKRLTWNMPQLQAVGVTWYCTTARQVILIISDDGRNFTAVGTSKPLELMG